MGITVLVEFKINLKNIGADVIPITFKKSLESIVAVGTGGLALVLSKIFWLPSLMSPSCHDQGLSLQTI